MGTSTIAAHGNSTSRVVQYTAWVAVQNMLMMLLYICRSCTSQGGCVDYFSKRGGCHLLCALHEMHLVNKQVSLNSRQGEAKGKSVHSKSKQELWWLPKTTKRKMTSCKGVGWGNLPFSGLRGCALVCSLTSSHSVIRWREESQDTCLPQLGMGLNVAEWVGERGGGRKKEGESPKERDDCQQWNH